MMSDLTGGVHRFAQADHKLAIVRWLQAEGCRLVFLFNGCSRNLNCTLTLDGEFHRARDIWNDEDVHFHTHKGISKKLFHLERYAVKILKI